MTTARGLPFLVGRYDGAETMHASAWAPAGTATSTISGEVELDGSIIVQRYTQYRDGAESFASLGVWMTDPATGEYLYYAYDSAGFPADPPARGTWREGELVLDRDTPRGSSRLVICRVGDGWSWSKTYRVPGASEWQPVQDALFSPA
ncbi:MULTISPECIES: hypothetical protein [unclassified Allobranchiibius]|uniref:hypothetical protein n=1 Tax=unclassified Allobranchiibius TaxID=2649857 RepID=UPI001AA0CE7C|nr:MULTISPECIES: hypothetical protein [unclassified Allobranchiibius]MBO1765513.1 hypothetical protein [Allobranchiibius sp. GilTou38]UIJ35379.1 hypothetical protein LVQ62_03035 [Allobranchiibius sp. GilTou73]